jgi:hypothetical protein
LKTGLALLNLWYHKIMKKNLFIFLALLILTLFPLYYAYAVIPLGSKVLAMTICINGYLLVLSPPTPGLYLFPFTPPPLLLGLPPVIASWVLGLAFPGGVCICGPYCAIPALGTFFMIGTTPPAL